MNKKAEEIKPTYEQLLDALEEVVRQNVANIGTDSMFISCHTYGQHIPGYWNWAIHLLERSGRLKRRQP